MSTNNRDYVDNQQPSTSSDDSHSIGIFYSDTPKCDVSQMDRPNRKSLVFSGYDSDNTVVNDNDDDPDDVEPVQTESSVSESDNNNTTPNRPKK